MVNKAIPIAKALYFEYSFLFIFDNAISHAVYTENAPCTGGMNKSSEEKQALLRDSWFETDDHYYFQ